MYKIRLGAIALLSLITVSAAYLMQVFLGVYYQRDLIAAFGRLKVFNIIVVVLVLSANTLFWIILTPLEQAVNAMASGRPLSDAERKRARQAGYKSTYVILATIIVAYIVGPIAGIFGNIAAGIATYNFAQGALIIVINFAIGAMAGTHCLLAVENYLRKPLESLGLYRLEQSERYVSLRSRIMLPAVSSLFLTAMLFTSAGYGYLTSPEAGPGILSAFFLETAILSLIIIGWGSWLSWSIASDISKRLRQLSTRVERLAEGSGELTSRVDIARNDGIGKLTSEINGLLDTVNALVGKIRVQAERTEVSGRNLAVEAEKAESSVTSLNLSLSEGVRLTENQDKVVDEAKARIDQIVSSINAVADMVSGQASFVAQSSAAVSQMAANIGSVTRTAAQADRVAVKLTKLSEEGGSSLKKALAHIRDLEGVSKSVQVIVSTISKIAGQTNLLAMNAAIEAAHAGSAGAGFAVVADEVRNLAESASKSAKEVGVLIKDMASRIATGVSLADGAGSSFDLIRAGVDETTELVRTIAASMSEQQAGAEEILGSVSSLTDAIQAIQDQTGNQRFKSEEMRSAMESIVAAAKRLGNAISEQMRNTEALAAVVRRVNEEAAENLRGSAELISAVVDYDAV